MKKLLLLIICVILFSIAQSQEVKPTDRITKSSERAVRASLIGKIADAKTGEVLPGASIYFTDAKIGAMADASGNYHMRNIPAGKYLIEVSYLGYNTVVQPLNLNGDVVRDFLLSRSVAENQGVTITGVSTATLVKKAPVPVTIFRRTDLLRTSGVNIIDALVKVPGVSQISTGGAISKPSIRGLGYNRVVVVNDGVRQEGQQWGDEHGIEIDEYSVNRVEVLKGPGSIMYGSDALAGVVNIISNLPISEGYIKGNLMGNYQTNNKLRGFFGNLSGNNKGFNWNVYGSYKGAADYENKFDGRVFNSKFNENNFGGYIGINKNWGYSHLLISNFNQRVGLIEGARDSSGEFMKLENDNGTEKESVASNSDFTSINPYIPRQHIRHLKFTSDNNINVGKGRLSVNLAYQKNLRQEFGDVLNPEESQLYFDLKTIDYNLQYHFPQENWQTSIGIGGMQQVNNNKGTEVLIPEYNLFDIGGFIFSKKEINKFSLSGGLRFDSRTINSKELQETGTLKFPGFKRNYFNVSGSAGFSYEISGDVIVKLNVAKGFRAPSIPELASNGAHEGTNRFEYGEQDLRSETSFQLDGGIEINTEHLSLTGNLFYNGINNFIYYRKLQASSGGDSIIVDGTQEFAAFRFDQHNAKLFGGEFIMDIHPHPLDWLHFENTFSYVRGMLNQPTDGSKNLPFIPAAKLRNEIRGDFKQFSKTFKNVYLKVEVDNTFSQNQPFTGYNTETTTPGYSLLNGSFGADFVRKGTIIFSIFIAGNNLTDVAYQSHLSRLKYLDVNPATGRIGVFNMGRNFSIKLNIPLSFRIHT